MASIFDIETNRRGSGSYKWDSPTDPETIPMWVADMDFKAAPAIIEALRKRVEHGVFGYTKVPGTYYDAVCDWFSRRHNWSIDPESIIYTIGVVPGLSASIKALAGRGNSVIVQTPVYNLFFTSVRNNGCNTLENRLINTNGNYTIDFDDLRAKAADPEAKVMVICNPHNPVGRIWTQDELREIATICRGNNVILISDEIHCELTYGTNYNPVAPIAEEVGCKYVTLNSPSKAFNIAGLQIANIVCPDAQMRAKIDRAINDNEVCDVNPFGVVALIAAYNESEGWLRELCAYIHGNYEYAREFFATHFPDFVITPMEASYLMWIDVSASGMNGDEIADKWLNESKIMVSPGSIYGSDGINHIRLNLATSRSRLAAALDRLT